jgi:hypothetical protein
VGLLLAVKLLAVKLLEAVALACGVMPGTLGSPATEG